MTLWWCLALYPFGRSLAGNMRFLQKAIQYENYFVFLIIPIFWTLLLSILERPSSYWFKYWWMFPVALTIATIVNTVGISGAALFVPFFVLIFPFLASALLPEQSVKLGLITESFGLSSSALAFLRFGLIDKKLGLYSALGAAPFVIGGAIIAFFIPKFLFNFLIASALLIAVYLLSKRERTESKTECIEQNVIGSHHKGHLDNTTLTDKDGKKYKYCRHGWLKRFVFYGFGGVFQGIAGFGVGELGIVSMVLTKIPIRVAIGTSHIIVASTAILASLSHLSQSFVHNIETPWNILFMTPYIAARVKTQILETFVSGLFTVLALALIYLGIKGF